MNRVDTHEHNLEERAKPLKSSISRRLRGQMGNFNTFTALIYAGV